MVAVGSVCESPHPVAQDLEIQGNVLYCLTLSAPAVRGPQHHAGYSARQGLSLRVSLVMMSLIHLILSLDNNRNDTAAPSSTNYLVDCNRRLQTALSSSGAININQRMPILTAGSVHNQLLQSTSREVTPRELRRKPDDP